MAKKIFNIFTTVLLILLIILVVLSFIARASGNSLSIFGVRVYRVASGSMEPTLKKDDVIVISKTSFKDIKKGDIITYKANQGEMAGQPVTHRVVIPPENRNGTWILQTQGDAEGAPLDPEITESQVIGKYVFTLPLVGYFYSFFLTPYGLLTIVIVIILLFGYEMISLIVSYKTLDRITAEVPEDEENKDETEQPEKDTSE